MADAAPVTPEPTAPAAPPANPLSAMTPQERHAWKADDSQFDYGETPKVATPEPLLTPAASSPAEPVAQVASTEVVTPAASEPAAPIEKNTAETRIKALLAANAQLEARLQAHERQPSAPVVRPTPDSATFPAFEAWTVDHPTDSYEAYLDARTDFRTEQRLANQQQQTARDARLIGWKERLTETVQQDPQFLERVSPEIRALTPAELLPDGVPIRAEHIIAQEMVLLRNPRLMEHFTVHPDEFATLKGLTSSADIIREMGRLDERLSRGPATPVLPPKLTTSAPPPPKLVNQRPAETADPVMAAVNSGDYRAFKAAENAAARASR